MHNIENQHIYIAYVTSIVYISLLHGIAREQGCIRPLPFPANHSCACVRATAVVS